MQPMCQGAWSCLTPSQHRAGLGRPGRPIFRKQAPFCSPEDDGGSPSATEKRRPIDCITTLGSMPGKAPSGRNLSVGALTYPQGVSAKRYSTLLRDPPSFSVLNTLVAGSPPRDDDRQSNFKPTARPEMALTLRLIERSTRFTRSAERDHALETPTDAGRKSGAEPDREMANLSANWHYSFNCLEIRHLLSDCRLPQF
jgi:hypothetical protein